MTLMKRATTALALGLFAAPVLAQAAPDTKPVARDAASELLEPEDGTEQFPQLLMGTLGVEGDLIEDRAPRTTVSNATPALSPWMTWKAGVQARTGITFGGSYGVLWQSFSNSRFGEDNSVGHKFTLNLSKALLNAGKPNALTFDIALEDRRPLGTDLPP
ncbi:MAG: hypothetical protein RL490_2351, partial [Pseudomonadota bacterium]